MMQLTIVTLATYVLSTIADHKMGDMITCLEQNDENPLGYRDKIYSNYSSPECRANMSLCETYMNDLPYKGRGDVCDHTDPETGIRRNACYFNTIFGAEINEEKTWSFKCWEMARCPLKWCDKDGIAYVDENGNPIGRVGCKITNKRINCCCQEDYCNGGSSTLGINVIGDLIAEFAHYGNPDHFPVDYDALCALVADPKYAGVYVEFDATTGHTECTNDPFPEENEQEAEDEQDEYDREEEEEQQQLLMQEPEEYEEEEQAEDVPPEVQEVETAELPPDAAQTEPDEVAHCLLTHGRASTGQRLESLNGEFYAELRATDARFCVYRNDGTLVYFTPNWGTFEGEMDDTCFVIMQGDNNLVIYCKGAAMWSSKTCNKGEVQTATMVLTDEGSLNVIDEYGVLLWTSQATVSSAGGADNATSSDSYDDEEGQLVNVMRAFQDGEQGQAKDAVNLADIVLVASYFVIAAMCIAIGVCIGSKWKTATMANVAQKYDEAMDI